MPLVRTTNSGSTASAPARPRRRAFLLAWVVAGGLLVVGVLMARLGGSPQELKQESRGAAVRPEGGPVLAGRGPAPQPSETYLPLQPTAVPDDPGGNPGDGPGAPNAAGDADAPGLPKERSPLEVLVVDRRGGGVPGARVRARWGEWDTAEARADREGRLTMNVPPGASSLLVTGWDQSDERTFFLVHQHPLEPNQRSTRVVVRSGGELSGRLLTTEGTPIPYAVVGFVKPGLGFWGMRTDTEGRFRGHYLDGVGTDLVFNGELDPQAGDAVRTFALYRALLKDVHAGDRDLRLVASPVAADADLEVLALDPEGWPLPGVLIQAHQGRSAPLAFAESDESGRVTLRNLARWPLSLTAQLFQQRSTRFLRAEPLTGVFPGGAPVEMRFVEFPSVTGRVVDEAGQPVARAWCAVLREGSIVACFGTDTQGRFRDCPNVPAGTRVQVTARYPMENWTSLGLLDEVEAGTGDLTVVVRPIYSASREAR